jgi:subtilisin family serine protease
VALLDTGCGFHPWLQDIVKTDLEIDGTAIGYTEPATAPESVPDQAGMLDGGIDTFSGHGTFMAGLVHQGCSDADILAWRITPSAGPIPESELVNALAQIAELARRHRAGDDDGHPIDILNLSMGYFHELPDDIDYDAKIWAPLRVLAENGVVVTVSAGNDSTTRPAYPAAFCAWKDDKGPEAYKATTQAAPLVTVGALNPNGSDALFSNVGPWVRAFAPGAAVMSTVPLGFRGGYEPVARTEVDGRIRESVDPDDYSSGFGLWSGTSFSAPLWAGLFATRLGPINPQQDDAAAAIARVWPLVTLGTDPDHPLTP